MRKPSVLVVWLTVFIDLIGFGIVVPLVPLFSKHFGAHGFVIGVVIASFSAMQFIFARSGDASPTESGAGQSCWEAGWVRSDRMFCSP